MSAQGQRALKKWHFLKFGLGKDTELLVGCFYRSISGTKDNNEALISIIKAISVEKYKNNLLMGDFNFPDINWTDWTCSTNSTENFSYRFIEAVRDFYLYQHITKATRGRGTDTPNTLNLIFTNHEDTVGNIDIMGPLGKSDYSIITSLNCKMECKTYYKKIYHYDKGDYEKMRKTLKETNWLELFHRKETDEQWHIFRTKFIEVRNASIPSFVINGGIKKKRMVNTLNLDSKAQEK